MVAKDAHGAQKAEGHRQVEARAFFADVGGSEVDRDGFTRVAEARVDERRLDAFAALADRRIRQADGDEVTVGPSGVQVDLDVDRVGINAEDGRAFSFGTGSH